MNPSSTVTVFKTSAVALAFLAGCGESPASPEIVDYALVSKSSAGLTVNATLMKPSLPATAGDVLRLSVVGLTAEGIAVPAPEGARVAWSGLPVVVVSDGAPSPVMGSDNRPSGIFLDNAARFAIPDDETLVGLLDANSGLLKVTAELSGLPGAPRVLAGSVSVSGIPHGDVDRGQKIFSENCTSCHGAAGSGGGGAPGLNGAPSTMATGPEWTAPVFAVGARIGMDARGVRLHAPMPVWLAQDAARGELLSTRDFADMYAFLRRTLPVSP